ncbi:alpha/beta hydrolase, partial [Streptomyces sp. SP17KL33]|uniref:alpha/beta hydrolase n=1 Tax=Streptomyces sp. SP17KL33 TaxID=3002534 RepID=UPI002E7781FE
MIRRPPRSPPPSPHFRDTTLFRSPAEHADEFGGDAGRIVIAGASAGGGLTAALALLTRDRKGP